MLSSKYPNFEKDLLNEVTLQKVALSIIKIRTVLNRAESGHHNPTVLSLVDLARQNGYEVEIEMKRKKF